MSTSSAAPDEFLQFVQRRIPRATGEDFLPRSLYGDYLEEVLLAAQLNGAANIRLEVLRGEVTNVRRIERQLPLQVELQDGRAFTADDVVLAIGNPKPASIAAAAAVAGHPAYVADPWATDLQFSPEQNVLLIARTRSKATAMHCCSLPRHRCAICCKRCGCSRAKRRDVHRHRLPSQLLQRVDALRGSQRLHIHAGRIRELAARGERIEVTWLPRGAQETRQVLFDRIVNCTGPDYAIERLSEPLWRNLLQCGLCVPDPLGLGLRTGPKGAVIDADGWPGPHLFYVGPMLRADLWEATAASELRGHCEQLAALLANQRS